MKFLIKNNFPMKMAIFVRAVMRRKYMRTTEKVIIIMIIDIECILCLDQPKTYLLLMYIISFFFFQFNA